MAPRRWLPAIAAAAVLSGLVGQTPATAAVTDPPQTSHTNVATSPLLAGAGGESFVAGDGGAPYVTGTDTPENRCHRSTTSATRMLHRAGLINLVMDTSCSGATIDTFMNGMYNEAGQVGRIPPGLQVYFLGIGGNDIGFGMVSGCILQTDCTKTQIPAGAFEQISKLGPRLDTVYKAVKAAVPRGKVIVQLYPYILPPPNTTPGLLCRPYLQSGEAQIGYDLTTRLNAVIIERARANGLLTADPNPVFAGHDVCGALTFFYPPGIRATFHPNFAGRFALAWTNLTTYVNN